MEEFSGEIIAIIYQNDLNSYTIAEMYIDEKEKTETIVGYLPFVNEGDNIKVVGRYVEHREYGKQFKVETFEKIMPKTLDALERYLGNGSIKGLRTCNSKKNNCEIWRKHSRNIKICTRRASKNKRNFKRQGI